MRPIGFVRSPIATRGGAPRQGPEGRIEALVDIDPAFADALAGLSDGDEIILLTWLDRSRRDVLKVYPRGDRDKGLTGVFATRSPDRPNPIGLHRVRVMGIDPPARIRVRPLEVLDGTPVVDIKPASSRLADA